MKTLRLECDENAGFTVFFTTAILLIAAIALTAIISSRDIKIRFVNAGYDQVVVPGSTNPVWQKSFDKD